MIIKKVLALIIKKVHNIKKLKKHRKFSKIKKTPIFYTEL